MQKGTAEDGMVKIKRNGTYAEYCEMLISTRGWLRKEWMEFFYSFNLVVFYSKYVSLAEISWHTALSCSKTN